MGREYGIPKSLSMLKIDFDKEVFRLENCLGLCEASGNSLALEVADFLKEWFNDSDKVAISSSGTTGVAKTFFVEKRYMRASAAMTADYFDLDKGKSGLLCLSTKFIAGKMMLVRAIESEMKLWISKVDSNPLEHLNQPIDFCPMVPLQVTGSIEKIDHIKSLLIGGAGLDSALENEIKKRHSSVFMSFGMAETLSHIAIRNLKDNALEYTILDGVDIGSDIDGCLIVNAPHLGVKGLKTKDLIEKTGSNRFRWLGRYDNLINSGGVKIRPEKLEAHIRHLIPDNDFFIGALPDDQLGESVVLIIEGIHQGIIDGNLTKADFKGIDRYQIPKKVFILRRFSRTDSQKIQRKKIVKDLLNGEILFQKTL